MSRATEPTLGDVGKGDVGDGDISTSPSLSISSEGGVEDETSAVSGELPVTLFRRFALAMRVLQKSDCPD
jgi:hypothetical protein